MKRTVRDPDKARREGGRFSLTILRDPLTGQVRAIPRDPPVAVSAVNTLNHEEGMEG